MILQWIQIDLNGSHGFTVNQQKAARFESDLCFIHHYTMDKICKQKFTIVIVNIP